MKITSFLFISFLIQAQVSAADDIVLEFRLGSADAADVEDGVKVDRWNNEKDIYYVSKHSLIAESGIDELKIATQRGDSAIYFSAKFKSEVIASFKKSLVDNEPKKLKLIVVLASIPHNFTGKGIVFSTNLTEDEAHLLEQSFDLLIRNRKIAGQNESSIAR